MIWRKKRKEKRKNIWEIDKINILIPNDLQIPID